jgi:hypothetical protein
LNSFPLFFYQFQLCDENCSSISTYLVFFQIFLLPFFFSEQKHSSEFFPRPFTFLPPPHSQGKLGPLSLLARISYSRIYSRKGRKGAKVPSKVGTVWWPSGEAHRLKPQSGSQSPQQPLFPSPRLEILFLVVAAFWWEKGEN